MEALRIIAMFFVLMLHANFLALGWPTSEEVSANPLSWGIRIFFESLSIGAVDIFVLISGWFGIQPKLKSFGNLTFQCLFFGVGIYISCVLTNISSLSLTGTINSLYIRQYNWFVPAYILLYILSPVLNAFIEHSTKKQFSFVIISFYTFQSIYAWIIGGENGGFLSGYSTISFIGLYLLARYVRLHSPKFTKFSYKLDLVIFISLVLLNSLGDYVLHNSRFFQYNSLIVIFSSLHLLLAFSKLRFHSRIINWIASSSFAVFLLHIDNNILPYFLYYCRQIYQEHSGIKYLATICVFLTAVFAVSVLLDKIRICCWKPIATWIEKRTQPQI